MAKKLNPVNVSCSECGQGERCKNWKEIKDTVSWLNAHYSEEHKNNRLKKIS